MNNEEFFDSLIESARRSIDSTKKLTYQERLEMLLDYLDKKYEFYTNSCPLVDLYIDRDSIDICDEELCCNYGSEKCWLYWLTGGKCD